MAPGQITGLVGKLRRCCLLQDLGLSDGQLLASYLGNRDEAAFGALMRRHGPMVWGVCRRLLPNVHDAEDAFQATFLVLVRRAASIEPKDAVGNWLYGVAYRTALDARSLTAKRRAKEGQLRNMARPSPSTDHWSDLKQVLDEELSRLKDGHRMVIVLCDLEGRTKKEAANQLHVPEGTIASRLARGRAMLAKRLARRGITLTAGSLAAAMLESGASAAVPGALMVSTMKAAMLFAAGKAATTGIVSPTVAALLERGVKIMWLSKLQVVGVVLMVASLAGWMAGTFTQAAASPALSQHGKPAPQIQPKPNGLPPTQSEFGRHVEAVAWAITQVETEKNTIGVMLLDFASEPVLLSRAEGLFDGAGGSDHLFPSGRLVLEDIAVANDAEVIINGKQGEFKNLKKGMRVSLRLAPDRSLVNRIEASSAPSETILKVANAEKNTVTVTLGAKEVSLPLGSNPKFIILGKDNAGFDDLKPGMLVDLQLGVAEGKIVVKTVRAASK
jgi:RNA polymerase sigma factor (sigma-70 family)